MLGDGTTRILDCRFDLANPDAGRANFETGHIPGAVYAHLDLDLAGPIRPDSGRHPLPDADWLAARFGRFGIGNDSVVVVYDGGNGAMAARAWWLFRWLGQDNVRLLDGGLDAWLKAGGPIEAGAEKAPSARFVAQPRDDLVLSTEEIVGCGSSGASLKLVDARDAARFCGEAEPIDPVAGHIPGCLNMPLTNSIGEDGLWKSPKALAELWKPLLGDDKSVDWSVMCGSGVTACHLALSGIEAGYAEPRVYIGSWSEWIRDPARPVATGSP